jgi:hypothetical protein
LGCAKPRHYFEGMQEVIDVLCDADEDIKGQSSGDDLEEAKGDEEEGKDVDQ